MSVDSGNLAIVNELPLNYFVFCLVMSLNIAYSSDEEVSLTKDAFGLSSLPTAKKPRVESQQKQGVKADSAPHVLSEVCIARDILNYHIAK
jgi:hypothetical protein